MTAWRLNDPLPELAWSKDAHDDVGWSVAFDQSGERVATTSLDVCVLETHSGNLIARLPKQELLVTGAAFVPGKNQLVTGGFSGEVIVWDLGRCAPVVVLADFPDKVHGLAIDPQGAWLAAALREGVTALWDLTQPLLEGRAPDQLLKTTGSPVWTLRFSEDGAWLACGDEVGEVQLWRCADWTRLASFSGDQPMVRNLDFAPGGARLLSSHWGGAAVNWDLNTIRAELVELGLGF